MRLREDYYDDFIEKVLDYEIMVGDIQYTELKKMEKKTLLTIAVHDMDNDKPYTKILGLFDKVPSEDFAKGMVMEYICNKYSIEREDYDDFIFEADVDAYILCGGYTTHGIMIKIMATAFVILLFIMTMMWFANSYLNRE